MSIFLIFLFLDHCCQLLQPLAWVRGPKWRHHLLSETQQIQRSWQKAVKMVGPAWVILLDNPFSIQLTLLGLEDYGIKLI
jgi:hypothetical protein